LGRAATASIELCFSGQFWQQRGMKKIRQRQPTATIEHVALLSVKHNIFPTELFEALRLARERGKTTCQNLAIEYRGSVEKEAIFLITKESAVIGQFRVIDDFLQRKDIPIKDWMNTDKVRRQVARQKTDNVSTSIQNLRHGMKRVNVEAEILEMPVPFRICTQYGNTAMVANALIGDETGKVKLCLWNEQRDLVNTGDMVQIKNASVSTYKGETQLRLGKSGTVSVVTQAKKSTPEKINALL
jgi:replication factor A1